MAEVLLVASRVAGLRWDAQTYACCHLACKFAKPGCQISLLGGNCVGVMLQNFSPDMFRLPASTA
jgi:hypothetical protein